MKVGNESTNTDKMQQHRMAKSKAAGDALRHEDGDLMVCTDLIDQSRTMALGRCSDHATLLEVLAANPDDKAMTSDDDPQLLLKIYFKERVNLSSVSLRFSTPPGAKDDDDDGAYSKPRLVKLYGNMGDLDFVDVESAGPAAQIVVDSADATEAKIPCAGHKFHRLESLQVFVEEAMDEEATRSFLNRVSIVGHQAQSYHAQYA